MRVRLLQILSKKLKLVVVQLGIRQDDWLRVQWSLGVRFSLAACGVRNRARNLTINRPHETTITVY